MLIQEYITIHVNNFTVDHFKSIGYSVSINDKITIPINHLPKGSGLKIDVKCNYCGKIFKKAYRRYLESSDDICCTDCRPLKFAKSNLLKYGVECTLWDKNIRQKVVNTFESKYGTDNPIHTKEIRDKIKTSMYNNGSCPSSKGQRYIHSLYGGELNKQLSSYFVDIYFPDEKIYFEYDGGGHDLAVKSGMKTKEEFEKKEYVRTKHLLKKGYKEFRIINNNKKDKLSLSDEELLIIKDRAFDILLNQDFRIYKYNLNTKTESFKE